MTGRGNGTVGGCTTTHFRQTETETQSCWRWSWRWPLRCEGWWPGAVCQPSPLTRWAQMSCRERAGPVCKHDPCWCSVAAVVAHRMDSVLTVLTARRASVAGRWTSSTRVLALSSVSLHTTTFFSCPSLSHFSSLFCLFSSSFLISFSFFLRAERSLRLHTPRAWRRVRKEGTARDDAWKQDQMAFQQNNGTISLCTVHDVEHTCTDVSGKPGGGYFRNNAITRKSMHTQDTQWKVKI